MQFKDITGLNKTKASLIEMVKENRVPHAMLLLGNEGVGKLQLALAFAQYLNCENKQDLDSCGECNSCLKAAKNIHPDIHFSYPTITKKVGEKPRSVDFIEEWREAIAENPYLNHEHWVQSLNDKYKVNRKGNITIAECHDLIRKLNLKSYEGEYKIMIIWSAEFLGTNGNSLLKIFEEPPEKTIFLLIAESEEFILNTILSRMQIMNVGNISQDQIEEALISKLNIEASKAKQISILAEGSLNKAQMLAENDVEDHFSLFRNWGKIMLSGDTVEQVKFTDTFHGLGKERQKNFFNYSLYFFREMISEVITKTSKLSDEEKECIPMFETLKDIESLEKVTSAISKAIYHIDRNAHPKVLFLNLTIETSGILKKQVPLARS